MNTYRAGIDIGSTTVKLVLLDEEGKLLFGEYRRHCAHTQEALSALLREARERVGDCALRAKITGSGAINLAKALGIPLFSDRSGFPTVYQFPVFAGFGHLPFQSREKYLGRYDRNSYSSNTFTLSFGPLAGIQDRPKRLLL